MRFLKSIFTKCSLKQMNNLTVYETGDGGDFLLMSGFWSRNPETFDLIFNDGFEGG